MKLIEKTISQSPIYQGKIFNVRRDKAELNNGDIVTREVVEHPGGVCILALEGDEVFLVRQFRYAPGEVLYELPAGKLEPGEDPLECAKRELSEEVGASAEQFTYFGKIYPSPAYLGETIYCYVATGLSYHAQHLDDDEFLEPERVSLDRVVEMILSGEIPDAKTCAFTMKYKLQVEGQK